MWWFAIAISSTVSGWGLLVLAYFYRLRFWLFLLITCGGLLLLFSALFFGFHAGTLLGDALKWKMTIEEVE